MTLTSKFSSLTGSLPAFSPLLRPFASKSLLSLRLGLGLGIVTLATPTLAQVGPGMGNIDCSGEENMNLIAEYNNTEGSPNGSNVVTMVGGYLLVSFAVDSGNTPGVIELFDVSDPRNPVSVARYEDADTQRFREQHSLPQALIDGREFVAFQTVDGIQIWEFTDPLDAKRVSKLDLPGISGGDYDNVAWQASWGGKFLYLAGANQGIYVIDAENPEEPVLLKQVPTGQTGGFRVGPLYAQGNEMFISNMDQNGIYATLDMSIPTEPALIDTFDDLPNIYASLVLGHRVYGSARTGGIVVHSIENSSDIVSIGGFDLEDDTLYVAVQDDFIFSGAQNTFMKIEDHSFDYIGSGTLGVDHPDHGQVTPIGNLIYVGNDHQTGSGMFCTQVGKDTTPPKVVATFPETGALNLPPNSRITFAFSDFVDLSTVSTETMIVRPTGGTALSGIYTYGFNTLTFQPTEPFAEDTTYEVQLPSGGVSDVMGNALTKDTFVTFSTGAEIIPFVPTFPDPMDPTVDPGDGDPVDEPGGMTPGDGDGDGAAAGDGDSSSGKTNDKGGCHLSVGRAAPEGLLTLLLLGLATWIARRRFHVKGA